MAQDDPYVAAGRHRIAAIDAAIAQAQADAQAHVVNNDLESLGESEQTIANLRADRQNLLNLHADYQRSQIPAPEPSEAELQAMPVQNMTHDQWFRYLNKTTKYGVDPDGYRRGVIETAARRARGE
jgi:hypothetical protein